MSRRFDIYIEYARKLSLLLEDPKKFLEEVKREIVKELPEARVYLFGSVARGRYTAASDIDILVVVKDLDEARAEKLKIEIKKRYPWAPLELHIVDYEIFKKWYKRFVSKEELIEI